jgi:hypothetical protein
MLREIRRVTSHCDLSWQPAGTQTDCDADDMCYVRVLIVSVVELGDGIGCTTA